MTPAALDTDLFGRVLDAAADLVASDGVARLSLSEVARRAGCSRATLYRLVPGGRDVLLERLAQRELLGFLEHLGARLAEVPDDRLDLALAVGLTTAARAGRDHPAFQRVVQHEPEVLLPYLSFTRVDRLYREAASAAAPLAERFVGADRAAWAVEWVVRVLVSYFYDPNPTIDLTDTHAALSLARAYLVPGLSDAARSNRPAPAGR